MPRYSFCCEACSDKFIKSWMIKEYDIEIKKNSCPSCGSNKVFRDYEEDNMVVSYHDVKTIGQLAEKNTKKMGKYELENRMRDDNMELHKQNKEVSARRRKINKMTPQQKKKWIMEGD